MKIPYNARDSLSHDKNMRPVEVMILSKDDKAHSPLEFRSIRAAYQFVEDCITNSDIDLHMIHSRVHINSRISEKWLLIAADASHIKHFLIRFKPTLS